MDTVERRILWFTGLTHFFTHFTMLIFPPLATTIARDIEMNLNEVFELSFMMYMLYGLFAVPWGIAADRWSPRGALAAGAAMAGIGLLGAALVQDYRVFRWFLAVVGLGNAAYHPVGLSLLSKGMRLRGRAMGINGICGNFGIAAAPFCAGILGWTMGWRWTFITFGIAGLAMGMLIAAVPFSVPPGEDRQKAQGAEGGRALRLFLIMCAAVVFVGLGYRTFTLILPSWLETRMGDQFNRIARRLPEAVGGETGMTAEGLIAALVAGGAMFIGMAGQMTAGKLADRIDLKKGYFIFFALALPCILAGRILPGWASIPFIGFFSFFSMGMQPLENSLYSLLIPPRWRSSGFGIKFTLAFGVGALAVRIVSRLEPAVGLDGVVVLIALYLAGAVLSAMMLLAAGRRTALRHVHHSAGMPAGSRR